jgi:alpha-glucosidase
VRGAPEERSGGAALIPLMPKRCTMRLFPLLLLCATLSLPSHSELRVNSPGGKVSLRFRVDVEGRPQWEVAWMGKTLLGWSPLGLNFRDGGPSRFTLVGSRRGEHDETYQLVIGKTKEARDYYRELQVDLQEVGFPRRRMNLLFRAYDDGAAFRYVLPEQDSLRAFEIIGEKTEFRFPGDLEAWAFQINTFHSSYEGRYLKTTLSAIPDTGLVYLPLTMQRKDGVALAILEADLTDYAGMYLRGAPGHSLRAILSPLPDGSGVAVRGRTPFSSPWRVLLLGDEPGRLIESTLILNLNPPCALSDVSWIKPGKAIFPWWPDFYCDRPGVPSALGFENQKYYIDFASECGFSYLELEPPWYGPQDDCIEHPEKYDITKPVPDLRLPELIEYGRKSGVRFFIWAHWRNVDRQMDQAFPLYRSWGAAGVKVDFMNRDDQEMIRWEQKVLEKAAANHLMVLFHGASKPTGTQRTYPNLLTVEGVLGNEQNKVIRWITPEHTVTIPFTRMLAGPMDFTPGGFRNVTAREFAPNMERPEVMGTRCHQLAMFVVYESPLTMVCDDPAAYRGQTGLEFLKAVPTSWDETRVLNGAIGRSVTIARRSGSDWYLGAMTDWSARQMQIPLEFLGPGTYEAEIFQDGPDADTRPVEVSLLHQSVTAESTLKVRLAKGGGAAMIFRKAVGGN